MQKYSSEAVVLPEKKQFAFYLQLLHLSPAIGNLTVGLGTFTAYVYDCRVRTVMHLPTCLFGRKTKIHLCRIEEVPLIKKPDLINYFAPNKHITTGHPVALSGRCMIPVH